MAGGGLQQKRLGGGLFQDVRTLLLEKTSAGLLDFDKMSTTELSIGL